ncbi:uroporphyrinogen-III synthase [Tabrizicola sp. J26]|uniref:uroporphyrinogen-III synthase n=1 Tax=Alitabrizicola rongguiensis TaxID=2909234 RepID=UPI001F38F04D|nr:uroporphyrinogen-III synthase [Tabrizicola rongguiensis]MCF1708247.1 uroporphyrinogen-III synthase [Tabrizicola rongguiensis]
MARQSRHGAPVFLLTRPKAQAARLADDFRARFGPDLRIVISPLIEPIFLAPDLPQRDWAGVLFTSGNGVEGARRLSMAPGRQAWCVGDATARAAAAAGYRAQSAGGDARDLADLVLRSGAHGPLLHARGDEVSGQLAEILQSAGIETHEAIVYRQETVHLSAEARALLAEDGPVIAPVYSPRTARLLSHEVEAIPPTAPLLVAAISRATARSLTFAPQHLVVATRPDGDAMLDAVAGLLATVS